MTAKPPSIPGSLDRHLSANTRDDLPGVSTYVDRGAALVTPEAIAALQRLRKPLHRKIAALKETGLQYRLELLATYFDEAATDGHKGTPAHCEVAFALLYFLKGFDRIPDSIPEVGLLDDAMIVQVVLQRNSTALRGHWLRRRRTWPAEL
ncbi:MAG: YkvA family protein [Verrucomicrobia bacterium]|nr:YkvA family protein [Verrucomicrobiota bacterium]